MVILSLFKTVRIALFCYKAKTCFALQKMFRIPESLLQNLEALRSVEFDLRFERCIIF